MLARVALSLVRRGTTSEQRGRIYQLFRRAARPAVLGTIRRTTPLSDVWGFDRGTPIDRYYIEKFLEAHGPDIRGRVLEVKDGTYTDRYGRGVDRRDVLDIDASNPKATVVADLTRADTIPCSSFDCFILTQTLQLIKDVPAAISHAHRILRPSGVLLVTVPVVSRIVEGRGLETDYWRFTSASCGMLFGERFGEDQITVRTYGNVLTGVAFLAGMAYEELSRRELERNDPYFPLIVTVRAVRE